MADSSKASTAVKEVPTAPAPPPVSPSSAKLSVDNVIAKPASSSEKGATDTFIRARSSPLPSSSPASSSPASAASAPASASASSPSPSPAAAVVSPPLSDDDDDFTDYLDSDDEAAPPKAHSLLSKLYEQAAEGPAAALMKSHNKTSSCHGRLIVYLDGPAINAALLLLVLCDVAVILGESLLMFVCVVEHEAQTGTEHTWEVTLGWISKGVVITLLLYQLICIAVIGITYLCNIFHASDVIVLLVSLFIELYVTSSMYDGFIIFLLVWRCVRIAHGFVLSMHTSMKSRATIIKLKREIRHLKADLAEERGRKKIDDNETPQMTAIIHAI